MIRRARERGATMIDAIVGSALMLMVFVGIFGAFQLTVDAVSNNKARAGAIALGNERLEYIRSLEYTDVGTLGGIPAGTIVQTEAINLNDVNYIRRVFVVYEDDASDGLGAADTNHITADYKSVKVSVSWTPRQGPRTIELTTRLSPPTGIESSVPGGTLNISVLNSSAQPIQDAQVSIVNATVNPAINLTTYSDTTGLVSMIGAPAGSGYQITVTKSGYSTAQTYTASSTNTNPSPAHLGVSNNQTTAATFAIDVFASKTIQTFSPVGSVTWNDAFADATKVAATSSVTLSSGSARLQQSGGAYASSGTIQSVTISPALLSRWRTISWIDSEPAQTTIVYRVYDNAGNALPDSQIAGNSSGFTNSPVDISTASTSVYTGLRLGATLTTASSTLTPSLTSWSLVYDAGPTMLPNIGLTLQGAKTIGSGPSGLVYKYNATGLNSGASGSITVSNLEWDTYTLAPSSASTYDVASSCGPQPETLTAGASATTRLVLAPHTTNSLLIDVKSAAGVSIPNASVRLYRAPPAFDTTISSDSCGQSFFAGLSAGTAGGGNAYSVSVTASGYTTYTNTSVNVSGTSRLSVIMN